MKTCSILALCIPLALAGCVVQGDDDDGDGGDTGDSGDGGDGGDSGDGDGGDSGDSGDGDGSGAVEPRTGVWDYSEYAPARNDCGLPSTYGNGGGGFGLVNHGDGTFTVIPNDGTDPFDCALDGADFSCPDRATEEAPVEQGLDATLVGQASAEGTFSNPENGAGTQTARIECEGGDCGVVEAATGVDFPCTLEVAFVIDWRSSP